MLSLTRRQATWGGAVATVVTVAALVLAGTDRPAVHDSLRSDEVPVASLSPSAPATPTALPVAPPPTATATPKPVLTPPPLPVVVPPTTPVVVPSRTLSPGQLAIEHDRALGYHGIPPHCAPSHACAYPGVWGAVLGGSRDATVTVLGPHAVRIDWYTEDTAGYDNGGPLTGFLVFSGTPDFKEFVTTREVDRRLRSATLTDVPAGRHVICVGEFNVEGLSAGACQPDIDVPGDPAASPSDGPTPVPTATT